MLLVSYWVVIFSVPFHFHSSVALPDSKEKGEAAGQEKVGGHYILFVQRLTLCQA